MKLKVNGKEQAFNKASLSIAQLLTACKVSQPDMVSVQLNGEFVNKENYQATKVKEGDEVDFLYFMGGGTFVARCSLLAKNEQPRATSNEQLLL